MQPLAVQDQHPEQRETAWALPVYRFSSLVKEQLPCGKITPPDLHRLATLCGWMG